MRVHVHVHVHVSALTIGPFELSCAKEGSMVRERAQCHFYKAMRIRLPRSCDTHCCSSTRRSTARAASRQSAGS